jgi:hypothetical protein
MGHFGICHLDPCIFVVDIKLACLGTSPHNAIAYTLKHTLYPCHQLKGITQKFSLLPNYGVHSPLTKIAPFKLCAMSYGGDSVHFSTW